MAKAGVLGAGACAGLGAGACLGAGAFAVLEDCDLYELGTQQAERTDRPCRGPKGEPNWILKVKRAMRETPIPYPLVISGA
jgi:hypothetical protein